MNILEHLVQQGLVVRQEGLWTLRQGAETTSLPEGLRQFLGRRIETLAPELYRLKGELLLVQDGLQEGARHRAKGQGHQWEEAEACFQSALAITRGQQARALELRAALSLSRLWQQHDKRDQARQVLTGVYRWFSEGLATPDLQEARALLEA